MRAAIALASMVLLAGCTDANPRKIEPVSVTTFPGDYRKMAECLHDDWSKQGADPRLTWRQSEKVAEVAIIRITGDYIVSWVVRDVDGQTFNVEYRTVGGMKGESPSMQRCAASLA
jgi:hypothetical protein